MMIICCPTNAGRIGQMATHSMPRKNVRKSFCVAVFVWSVLRRDVNAVRTSWHYSSMTTWNWQAIWITRPNTTIASRHDVSFTVLSRCLKHVRMLFLSKCCSAARNVVRAESSCARRLLRLCKPNRSMRMIYMQYHYTEDVLTL